MQGLFDNDWHFKVTDEGNILVSLPLLQEDDRGNHETEKDIQYNYLKEGTIEKVSIFDHRRYGIDRLFKSIRYVYDKDGLSARNKEFDGNRYRARRKTNDNR